MEGNSSTGLALVVSLLLLIPPRIATEVGGAGERISYGASSSVPETSSAKDCSGLFGWNDRCLIDRLRDPGYFGVSPEDASDEQLLAYIKSNEQTVAALLLQVDYGRDLSRFLKGNNLLGSEKDFIDALGKATGILDKLKQIADVLVALRESSGWTAVSESLDALGTILQGIQVYELAAQVIIAADARAVLDLYFQERLSPDLQRSLSKEDAWRDIQQDFDPVLAMISKAKQIPRNKLNEWFENAFVAYRLVGYSDSDAIRYAEGRALARLAGGGSRPPVVLAPELKIDGGPSSTRTQQQTFTFTGANFTAGRPVTRYMRSQVTGHEEILQPAVSADAEGNVRWSSAQCATLPGSYTVWVVDEGTHQSSNQVTEIVTASPACVTPTTVSTTWNGLWYPATKTCLSPPYPPQQITLQLHHVDKQVTGTLSGPGIMTAKLSGTLSQKQLSVNLDYGVQPPDGTLTATISGNQMRGVINEAPRQGYCTWTGTFEATGGTTGPSSVPLGSHLLAGGWKGEKVGRPAYLSIRQTEHGLSATMVSLWNQYVAEEDLTVETSGGSEILMRGFTYRVLTGSILGGLGTVYPLDTFKGQVTGDVMSGSFQDTEGKTGNWSVTRTDVSRQADTWHGEGDCYGGVWWEMPTNNYSWLFRLQGNSLQISRTDGYVSGSFGRSTEGWRGTLYWDLGVRWNDVVLYAADPGCRRVGTNQRWTYVR